MFYNAEQYNFQYITDADPVVSLKTVADQVQPEVLITVRVNILKGDLVEMVGKNNLKKLKTALHDGMNATVLYLWQNDIEEVRTGRFYMVKNVRVKGRWAKVLNQLRHRTPNLQKKHTPPNNVVLNDKVSKQALHKENSFTVTSKKIRSLQLSRYKSCVHCNKRLLLGLEAKIIKCDCCSHQMRQSDCENVLSLDIIIETDKEFITLTASENALCAVIF